MLQELKEFDKELFEKVRRVENPYVEKFLNSYTALGSFYLTSLFLGVAWALGPKTYVLQVSVGFAVMCLFVYASKHVIARPRPSKESLFFTYSFPSGHSATAFFLAVTLSELLLLSGVLYLLAFLVAFSRIYLEMHYPFDAATGSIIGVIAGYITVLAV